MSASKMVIGVLTVALAAGSIAATEHLEERTSVAATTNSVLPEVYLIGDSIRMGYCQNVATQLAGRASVRWPGGNCANSQNILINLGWWRKCATVPAVIQFNCGHWDAAHWDGDAEPITSLEEYRRNIRLIIHRLRKYYPKAKLVFATTTPMNPSGVAGGNVRTTEEIRRYNEVGVAVAEEEGVVVNDLFALVGKWPESDYADYCHFKPAANERLGKAVAEALWKLCDR